MSSMFNFRAVADCNEYPAIVRLLAANLAGGSSYITVSQWLQDLTDEDVAQLNQYTDDVTDNADGQAEKVLVTISELLAFAEGLEISDSGGEEAQRRVNTLMVFINLEGLARAGLIDFNREACTLGEEGGETELAKLKPGIDPNSFS